MRLGVLTIALVMMIGCHHEKEPAKKENPATMPTYYGTASRAPIAVESKPTLVKSGEAPLAYRVESNVTIRITDMDAGTTVATAAMKAGDFVAVTEDNGVVMGGERVVKGPLPEGHRYGIYVEQPSSNVFESGVITPTKPR
jgi:thiamine biosynthesis lipoprotein ApbE